MLEVNELHAGYGPLRVLRGISLTIGAGEIVAVLGSNGVGKTTLNNVLSGLVPVKRGRVRFDGQDITTAKPEAIVKLGLVQVPEGRRIFPNLSVRENLELGSYRRGKPMRARTIDNVVSIFPRLKERFTQEAGTLSGGEQQMLAIGRALMTDPRLLILDEPSLGLSPRLVEEMFDLIKQINESGLSILLVEQNVVQSLGIANRAYVLERGEIIMAGRTSVLASDPKLKEAYLGL